MRTSSRIALALIAATLVGSPRSAAANTLELALVIDGSSSISASDWQLQIGAYQNVFQNNFYSTFIAPSEFDDIAVAAYVFSGGFEFQVDFGGGNVQVFPVTVFSYLDWTLINDDTDAFNFGAQFAGLPQPASTTATADALNIATGGGLVSCPFANRCSPVAPGAPPFQLTATGLLNNAFQGTRLVIDISTDGVPTEPNGDGTPNATDRALAIAAADAARAAGITVNAIGVGDQLDAPFLEALVGINPAATPPGFFLTASGFDEFGAALEEKIGREVVPAPPAWILLATGLIAAVARAKGRTQRTS
jgi:Protein of unknown function (DUF1194)